MNTKNNTTLLRSKHKIETGDTKYIDHVKNFGKPYKNCLCVLFLDGNHEYGVKGLKYLGLRQRTEPRGTLCDYYEIKGRYYIKITIPDLKKLKKPKKLKFSGKTVDEARKKYVDYFSPHDIRQAPDGTSGQYDKFIRDALLGNLHGCSLEKRVKK